MIEQFMNEEEVTAPTDELDLTYDQLLGVSMKLVSAADYYTYDKEHKVWVDKTDDEAYMKELVDGGEDLKIVGIVQPKPEAKATALSMGIYYTPALTQHIIEKAGEARIVQEQLDDPPPMPKAENVVSGLICRTPFSVLASKICGMTL